MKLKEQPDYLYCTAIIQTTGKVSYEQLVEHLMDLRDQTEAEPGCMVFQVVPLEKSVGRFDLWEIWENQAAFYAHHEQTYTKEFFQAELDTIEMFESSEKVHL
ncbi:putative quinol monooxygenase [Listeria ivanovii]|uniref:Putative YjcS protein n=1 Tax=Listeria ivanovii (strain ATCC BAA-678 / PAM 55) TaxID=881621 RepID=G2ZEN4_LISIP|nr:antibiotic biosynthesis monooxygenase [Listeria ivanovii]AHI55611.1 antibiotic biosynthesis monooxygenase [Listeria ivanovii WSLC3009]AIS65064.1 antibiotic biosynthesis monooxygenase [Listeria ivanovii subsp. ivanovii]MBK3913090.1 antibiotic biosynthesis monooxygenase [Listeria ivanovii subsp. ivanovii]MBK3920793.1 antibiotic biosynthesis monooxygenase [Listeria ivanovii subsp. ivanovii]MBK3925381.1 antibiotic biosynthesis monooxygenase [Listeria ivanovii subsp. ivanovii]